MSKKPAGVGTSTFIARLAGLYLLALLLNTILLVFAELREYPPFWTNAGGYPIELRELVLNAFYPLLLVQLIVLGTASLFQFRALPAGKKHRILVLALITLFWLFFGCIVFIFTANNLENVMNGRGFHYHPPVSSQ